MLGVYSSRGILSGLSKYMYGGFMIALIIDLQAIKQTCRLVEYYLKKSSLSIYI